MIPQIFQQSQNALEFIEDGDEIAVDGGEFAEDGGELAVDDSTQGVPSADEYDVYSFFDAADTPDPGKLCHICLILHHINLHGLGY